MPIKGLTAARRLPRLGHIRLGIKDPARGGAPREIEYFLLDPNTGNDQWNQELKKQFAALYGEKPTVIDVMFPPVPPELFFPQWRKRYGSGTLLQCQGDGDDATNPGTASCISEEHAKGLKILGPDERGMVKVECLGEDCPYTEQRKCSVIGSLKVMLPELNGVGVWQINTGSYNSIVNVNSAIDWLIGTCGRYAMIKVKLMRVPQEIPYEGKKSTHYVLQVDTQHLSLGELQRAALVDQTRVMIEGEDAPEELADQRPKRVFRIEDRRAPAPDAPAPAEPRKDYDPFQEWVDAIRAAPTLERLEADWKHLGAAKVGAYWTFSKEQQVKLRREKDRRKTELRGAGSPAPVEPPAAEPTDDADVPY